jgi:hypothetical protein
MYFSTATNTLYWYNGTSWVPASGGAGAGGGTSYLQPAGGSTDDAPAINSRLTNFNYCELDAGTFNIGSPIVIPNATPGATGSGAALVGRGSNATNLKLLPSANCDVIQTLNFHTLHGTNSSTGGLDAWSCRHLTIDGNKANNATGGYGICSYAIAPQIEDVFVHDVNGIGMYWEGPATDPGWSGRTHHIHNIRVWHCNLDGFVLAAADSWVEAFTIFQCGTIWGDPTVTQMRILNGIAKLNLGHLWAGDTQYNLVVQGAETHANLMEVEGAPSATANGNIGASIQVNSNGFVLTNSYLDGNNLNSPAAFAFQFGPSGATSAFIAEIEIANTIMEGYYGGFCHDLLQGPHAGKVGILCFSPGGGGKMLGTCGTSFSSDLQVSMLETNGTGGGWYRQDPGAAGSTSHGYLLFTTTGTWTVPAGITSIRIRAVSGGGGGGGAGSANLSGTQQTGGAGGMAGQVVDVEVNTTPGQAVNITSISAGGAGGNGASAGGGFGTGGSAPGGSTIVQHPSATTVVNVGWNFNGAGTTSQGQTTPPNRGIYATNLVGTTTSASPGEGGSNSSSPPAPAFSGQPYINVVGGGAGGTASASNLGGGGGAAQQTIGGGVYLTGMSGGFAGGAGSGSVAGSTTANGVTGQTATQPGCGGGGGGGGAFGGAGGSGGAGANGAVEIWY